MAKEDPHAKLGDELVKQDLITREELTTAQKREQETGTPWYRQLIQMKKMPLGVFEDVLRREFHSKTARDEHQALGNTLLDLSAISEEQLTEALAEQKRNGRLLGNILLDRGYVTRQTIAIALSKQYGMEYTDLSQCPSAKEALDAVPESMARKNHAIPVRLEGDKLTVLVATPQTRDLLQDMGILLGLRLHAILTTTDDIRAEISRRYEEFRDKRKRKRIPEKAPATKAKPDVAKGPQSVKKKPTTQKETEIVATEYEQIEVEEAETGRFEEIAQQATGMPVIKLVSTIIEGAGNSGATDVHLDPQEPEMRVRYRIDGVLHDVMSIPADIEQAVISRIKIMSDMDITETRHPQDGHISMQIGEQEYDIRVASMPTFLGERVVLRLLDQTSVLAGVKDLGLENEDQNTLTRLIKQPYGMVLVTGPTGSGKTTTLYAALNQKNVMTESIVTLEDPVEYQLSGINQVQIDDDIDLTFANSLRAAMRQDIDVLLVGEIRDVETARIAIRAAMTGHLVFSTLHTNDAPEAISTLRNMGIPSYLISSALTAVIAQRLVRRICEKCKTRYTPNKALLKSIGLPESLKSLYKGKGCDYCYHTGTKGRTGIFEVLEVTPEIRRMIAAEESTEKIAKMAKLKTMAERCRLKAKKGIITPEEFLRVIRT
ncbi:MAG TPA: Flp pilus assembly complex ATPase component TadA [Candidatus Hydrogenedentes bacterium]|nr:Flp pilus assembly complex ATPase component TadA [Candidatus Hydrogenedentota bacterium]